MSAHIGKIGVVHYGAGNVGNLLRGIARIGRDARLLETPGEIADAAILVLPGVGAFPPAMECLIRSGWRDALLEWIDRGRPLCGICLGMHLLAEHSLEDGETRGLAAFRGVADALPISKSPHMGWNDLCWLDATLRERFDGGYFYFVHGYALLESPDAVATTEVEGVHFASLLLRGATGGCQFHPERSGPRGLAFLGRLLDVLAERGTR